MAKSVTMRDIADALDVSAVTVSKALADKEGVSDEVKLKIKKKAQEMGYRYNLSSKFTKESLKYNIGIIVSEQFFEDNSFYASLYRELMMKLSNTNYCGILEIISKESERICKVPNIFENNKVDGIILMGQLEDNYVKNIATLDVPYMLLDFYREIDPVGAIVTDNTIGCYKLTNYLISMGHRDIAFVGNIHSTTSIIDRYLGMIKSLLEHNRPINSYWLIADRDESGSFIDLKLPDKMPTAFVCNCDEIAFLLIKKLKSIGYKIPEDLSVVGFDDYIYATICDPKLTTYRVDLKEMAEATVYSLINKIQNPDYILSKKIIAGDIVIRDSVKKIK